MEDDALYADENLVGFYDLENAAGDDDAFVATLAAEAGSVLDLGCGTGRLAASLAEGRRVVGVDPAAAMLDIARGRPGGDRARFVEGDAREVRLGERFDLIVLTGHAFQVFLTEADRAAVLATIAAHLAPAGRFVFDSRNPAVEEWREWVPAASRRTLDHPRHGAVTAWNDVEWDAATTVATYATFYRMEATGRVHEARSRIAFPARAEIERLIAAAGLAVDRWYGDWTGGPCTPTAREIIPVGRLAG